MKKIIILIFSLILPLLAPAVDHAFRLEIEGAHSVDVAGEFNEWGRQPMSRISDNLWVGSLWINPGEYAYKFIVDGDRWILDPANSRTKAIDGVKNSLVFVKANETTAKASSSANPFLDDLPTMQKLTFTIPMRTDVRFDEWKYKLKEDPNGMATFSVALPKDFDPQRADYNIAIISQTADGDACSVGHMNCYYPAALRQGWICLAVDRAGGETARKDWSGLNRRWVVLAQVLDAMHEAWPASKKWNYATMGFSGGVGYANYLGAMLVAERYKLAGIWQGGSGYVAAHFQNTLIPDSKYYHAKYAISWGSRDTVCSRNTMIYARRWAEESFREFNYEEYDGGHSPFEPHIENALIWFAE